jgi:negative regulator of sigma E activity
MSLTAELQPKAPSADQPSIWSRNSTLFSKVQIATFLIGILLTAVFGLIALEQKSAAQQTPPGVSISIQLN